MSPDLAFNSTRCLKMRDRLLQVFNFLFPSQTIRETNPLLWRGSPTTCGLHIASGEFSAGSRRTNGSANDVILGRLNLKQNLKNSFLCTFFLWAADWALVPAALQPMKVGFCRCPAETKRFLTSTLSCGVWARSGSTTPAIAHGRPPSSHP